MKKILLLSIALSISISGTVYAQETGIVSGNLLVMLHSDEDAIILAEELQYLSGIKTDLKIERVLSKSMHIYLFNFNTAVIAQERMLKLVKNNPLVLIAQSNHFLQERIIPNDTQFGVMWDMNNTGQSSGKVDADIDAPEAWDITTGGLTSQGDTIVVAVIDGGFDLTQQDLNFWKNYKEIPNNSIDDDNNGYVDDRDGWNGANSTDNWTVQSHGTHVTGTGGAKGNNG
ncbi:MAG: hypothetical protein H0W84_05340, partial [Bacteroidetes bacterium]|nr:hypothetical protein [Bacteroidota bacterium]